MRLFAVTCMVLAVLSTPVLAQDAPDDRGPGVSPGMLGLVFAGGVLLGWGIDAAFRKSPDQLTCAQQIKFPLQAATTC